MGFPFVTSFASNDSSVHSSLTGIVWLVLMHDSHSSTIKLPGNFPFSCVTSPNTVWLAFHYSFSPEKLSDNSISGPTQTSRNSLFHYAFVAFIAFITTWFYCTFAFNIHILSVENKFQQKVNFVFSSIYLPF